MNSIKLDLTAINDQQINLDLGGDKAFSGVFKLGFVLGCKNPTSGQFATDETGLQEIKYHLGYTIQESLWSLSGIGALVRSANPVDLVQNDLQNIGTAIGNLARLGIEAKDYIEEIDLDLKGRRPFPADPEQAAIHAELHQVALARQQKDGFSYLDALGFSAMRISSKREQDNAVNELIEAALADGRLMPLHRVWAEHLGKTDFEALATFLEIQQTGEGAS